MSNEIIKTLRYLHKAIASLDNPDVCESWLLDADETLSALEVPVKRATTPEERKPMNEKEISAIWIEALRMPTMDSCITYVVRATEKHHKIGEGDE